MAFIFDYYGTEVYRRALSTTHQEATTRHIMTTMSIQMDVLPSEMRGGQKHAFNSGTVTAPKPAKTTSFGLGGTSTMFA
jgi:hypothetical protein